MKYVIKFNDGTYWECYQQTTCDIAWAWTFNKATGAQNTADINELKDFTIIPVDLSMIKSYR